MNAAIATQASKQAFIYNKGLLLTDRSFSGHSFFHTPFSFNRESLCLEVSPYHIFLSAKSGIAGLSRIFCLLNFNPNRSISL